MSAFHDCGHSAVRRRLRMFTHAGTVLVKSGAPAEMRPGQMASVIGITIDGERVGSHFGRFPAGTVYLVEFEDGDALDIHESMLEAQEA